jgi:hypothetical protein
MPELVLPSGKKAEIVTIKGRVERELWKHMQARKPESYDLLCRACTRSIDGVAVESMEDILALHSSDRTALTLGIRRESYGSQVTWTIKCKECGDVERVAEIDAIDWNVPLLYEVGPITLPRSGKTATWALPTGHTELRYRKLHRGSAFDPTILMLSRMVELDGKKTSENQLDDLEGIDRAAILRALRRIGGPDTTINATCDCGTRRTTKFELLPELFLVGVTG